MRPGLRRSLASTRTPRSRSCVLAPGAVGTDWNLAELEAPKPPRTDNIAISGTSVSETRRGLRRTMILLSNNQPQNETALRRAWPDSGQMTRCNFLLHVIAQLQSRSFQEYVVPQEDTCSMERNRVVVSRLHGHGAQETQDHRKVPLLAKGVAHHIHGCSTKHHTN